jgi:phosphoglycerate dehydrogenase-like enzyme
MLGEAEFALMKAGAFLIDTVRGPVVQEGALIAALRTGKLAGAALDVLDPNCLITPHMAFFSDQALREMRETAARIVLRVLQGGSPIKVVNGTLREKLELCPRQN